MILLRLILPLLLLSATLSFQSNCTDLLTLFGERDISAKVQTFLRECGPFEESVTIGGDSKTYISEEKGIQLMFVNRELKSTSLPKYELLSIELTAFTDKGGYKEEFPFGLKMGMDHKMVKEHIKQLKDVYYEKKNLSKKSSSFTYTGLMNPNLHNRQLRVMITQFDGNSITAIRMRLK